MDVKSYRIAHSLATDAYVTDIFQSAWRVLAFGNWGNISKSRGLSPPHPHSCGTAPPPRNAHPPTKATFQSLIQSTIGAVDTPRGVVHNPAAGTSPAASRALYHALPRSYSSTSEAVSNAPQSGSYDDSVDCVVIGAGVIGLAVARALALRGREVVVVEAAGAVGTETSSRHSEVIHAGIYYKPGSLKARLCVEGKVRMYEFCRERHVPYKNVTKLIVAASKEQLPDLVSFRAAAARHGVPDLELLSGAEARALEPALACEGALLSPSTGILDSHTYMAALLADAEAHGAVLALNTRVAGGWLEQAPLTSTPTSTSTSTMISDGGSASSAHEDVADSIGGTGTPTCSSSSSSSGASDTAGRAPSRSVGPVPYKVLELHSLVPGSDGDGGLGGGGGGGGGGTAAAASGLESRPVEVSRLRARWVVNAAGLHAIRVAASMSGLPRSSIPRLHLAKGNYFSLSTRSPFSRLIYPMPEGGLAGLGIHLTLDMAGAARFGPDVEWLPGPGTDPATPVVLDYRVDPRRAESFYPAVRRYFPALQDGALQPAYSGVRPKLSGPGQPAADFMVQGARMGHGVRGWVNLYGIESPGLTSSLALAEYVCGVLEEE